MMCDELKGFLLFPRSVAMFHFLPKRIHDALHDDALSGVKGNGILHLFLLKTALSSYDKGEGKRS